MPEVLFRRRRRWPTVAGVAALLLAAAAVGVAVGTRDSGDGDAALNAFESSPSPTPSQSPQPSPEVTPEDTGPTGPLITFPTFPADVTDAPSTASSPLPSRSPRPQPTSTSPTAFAYPPPGISLQVTARRAGAGRAEITVRVRDTDGSFNGGRIDFGDGTDETFSQAVARCASPTPGPYRPEPSDKRLVLVHRYPRGGSFDVFVRVRTDRPCQGTPVEETSKAIRVTVDEPSPSAAPLPSPSATSEPSATPSPEPPPTG